MFTLLNWRSLLRLNFLSCLITLGIFHSCLADLIGVSVSSRTSASPVTTLNIASSQEITHKNLVGPLGFEPRLCWLKARYATVTSRSHLVGPSGVEPEPSG